MSGKSHSGHRGRLRRRVKSYGMDSLEDHEFLELLLYNVIPRKNTNNIAHELIERFGSLSGVFRASEDDLREFGLNEKAAFWIAHLNDFAEMYAGYYRRDNTPPFMIVTQADAFVKNECSRYLRENKSFANKILVVSIAVTGEIIYSGWFASSEHNELNNVNTVCRAAVRNKAYYVMIAHTYGNDVPMPTEKECRMTERYDKALKQLGMILLDRYHVTPMLCTSYLRMGAFFEKEEDFERSLYCKVLKDNT